MIRSVILATVTNSLSTELRFTFAVCFVVLVGFVNLLLVAIKGFREA